MNVHKYPPSEYTLATLGPVQKFSSLHYKLRRSVNAMCGQRSIKDDTEWTCHTVNDRTRNMKKCAKCVLRYARMLKLIAAKDIHAKESKACTEVQSQAA